VVLDSSQLAEPRAWPPQHHVQMADASSQYKVQTQGSMVDVITTAAGPASDTQLLALLRHWLQHSAALRSDAARAQPALLGLPSSDAATSADPPNSPVHVPTARHGTSAPQPRRRQPAVTIITPSPSSAGGRQRDTSTRGSPSRKARADAAAGGTVNQHSATANVQPASQAQANSLIHARGAAPGTASALIQPAATQTGWQAEGDAAPRELLVEDCLPEPLKAAHEPMADITALTEQLGSMRSERDAAIAAELEARNAASEQARCCLWSAARRCFGKLPHAVRSPACLYAALRCADSFASNTRLAVRCKR